MNFDLAPLTFFEQRLHCAGSKRGRITIAAEMTEHDPLDFSRKQLLDHACGRGVGKMTVPRLDPLFHRPGPMRIVLQHFLVVIRFDDERLHLAETLDQQFGRRNQDQ